MDIIYPYRGVAGETVRLFVRFRTIGTVVAALIFMLLATLLFIYVADKLSLPSIFNLLIILITVAPVLGSCGLGARRGDLESGMSMIFSEPWEVMRFVARCSALIIAMGVPCTLLAMLLITGGVGPQFFTITSFRAALMAMGQRNSPKAH